MGQPANPGLPGEMAVKMISICARACACVISSRCIPSFSMLMLRVGYWYQRPHQRLGDHPEKHNQEHFIVKVQGFKTAIEPTGSAVLLCLRRQCTDSICNLPPDITFYWFRNVASVHSSVGPSLLLARRSGTHWQMNCELTRVIYLRQPYKLSFSLDTSIYGALEALRLMRYINLHLT